MDVTSSTEDFIFFFLEARVQVNHLDPVRLVYFALVSVCGPLQGLSWKPG